jgi:hypothetical protein
MWMSAPQSGSSRTVASCPLSGLSELPDPWHQLSSGHPVFLGAVFCRCGYLNVKRQKIVDPLYSVVYF